jgi:hypothetical protein
MKYQRSETFIADYHRLSQTERDLFTDAVRRINQALRSRGDQALPHWPASLRVKSVRGVPGVLEMTWSYSGPDGRATFEIIEIDDEPAIRWRRIGGHDIFREP